jgi:hypothetical protein
MIGLLDPLPQRFIGGKAGGLPERLRKSGQDIWGERQGLAWRHVQVPQGFQATLGLAGEPVADGMAMDPEQRGHVPAGLGLSAGKEVAHLEPWFPTTVMFTLKALLEGLCIFGHDR